MPPPLAVRLALSAVYLPLRVKHESRCPEIGPICARGPLDPLIHDQRLDALEFRASAQLGLTENFAIELRLPLRVTVSDITYRYLDGTPFPDAPNGSLHHRDETLVGIGDPWLIAQTEWAIDQVRLGGFLGLTFPLGRIEDNPFAAGKDGVEHQHIQDGTGTFNPVLGAHVVVSLSDAFSLSLSAQARLTLYENSRGYQAGHSVETGLGFNGTYDIFDGGVSLDLLHQTPERWDGAVQEDGNLGTTTLLVGLNAAVTAGPVNVGLTLKFPVYQYIVEGPEGGELSYPVIVGFRIAGLIGGPD